MQEITKVLVTETAHRLINYSGLCAHFHGHSYRWEVTVCAVLDTDGMCIDFKLLKSILRKTIGLLDHATILCARDPLVKGNEDTIHTFLKATNGDAPRLYIVPWNPTVENIVTWQATKIKKELPPRIALARIQCWETATSSTTWSNNVRSK